MPDIREGADTSPIRVWLIDEQRLAREGLSRALPAISPMLQVKAMENGTDCAGNASERPDVCVLHLGSGSLLDPDTAERASALLAATPTVPLLVVSSTDDLPEVQMAMALGARGFFPTSLGLQLLAAAIRLLRYGGVFLPPDAAIKMLDAPSAASRAS